MFYSFAGDACPMVAQCPHVAKGDAGCYQVLEMAMMKAPRIGAKINCKLCKGGKLTRLASDINVIVRGTTTPTFQNGESYRMNLNGEDTRFTFVDHPHTDPAYQRGINAMARKAGIRDAGALGKAYRSEKHGGRLVVDVASNVPDPLGKLEAAKRRGDGEQQTIKVNQPYKTRKGSGRRKKG